MNALNLAPSMAKILRTILPHYHRNQPNFTTHPSPTRTQNIHTNRKPKLAQSNHRPRRQYRRENQKYVDSRITKASLQPNRAHFKKIEPNQAILWKRVAVFDQRLKNFAPDSLRAIYTKTLVKSPETYQDPELTFDFNPIESEWMENYNSILPILKEGRSPSSSSTKGIWLNNQKALAKKGKNV